MVGVEIYICVVLLNMFLKVFEKKHYHCYLLSDIFLIMIYAASNWRDYYKEYDKEMKLLYKKLIKENESLYKIAIKK